MMDMDGAWLRIMDADGVVLANLPWAPLVGIAGAFFGDAHATGRAATWAIQFPDGRRARGASGAGNIFPETLRVERRTVEDWMGELSSLIEPAPKAGDSLLVVGLPDHVTTLTRDELADLGWSVPAAKVAIYGVDTAAPGADQTVSLTKIPEGKPYVRTEVRFSSDLDLSPLANLATAVAWGLALERVVTEWRAWHPAARVSWDIRKRSLLLVFSVDGIGEVDRFALVLGRDGRDGDPLAGMLGDAFSKAAMAMAPYYVAGSRKAKAADRGAA